MSHALIIDENMAVSRAIQNRLYEFGYRSFDHTWTEQQALHAAAERPPDLIVVGDHVATGSAIEAARQVAARTDAPILAVTTDRFLLQRALPVGASIEGPYPLSELDAALHSAQLMA